MKRRVALLLIVAIVGIAVSEAWSQRRDRRPRFQTGPVLKVGDEAPDFDLPILTELLSAQKAGKDLSEHRVKTVKLSALRGGKPMVLLFSSYT